MDPHRIFHDVQAITFDCYGTLIDWETGIRSALVPLIQNGSRSAGGPDAARAIETFGRIERQVQEGPYRPYAQVLVEVQRRVLDELGVPADPSQADALSTSLPTWPAFAETPGCLRALKAFARLGVLSNIDDRLFAHSAPKLGVDLDVLVTAEQVRSYKPGLAHFQEGLRRLGLTPDRVLHVAESRFHDIEPAASMGIRTVWVNRAGGSPAASGIGGAAAAEPTLTVRSLRDLVALLPNRGMT